MDVYFVRVHSSGVTRVNENFMNTNDTPTDPQQLAAERPASDEVAAWEEVEAGRFMPRRVRGSDRGRALG